MPRGDFKVVTHPELAPACDFITRSTVGPFVDTGVDILMRPRPGMEVQKERVYLAFPTIAQLASLAGGADAVIASDREAQLVARGKLEGLKEGLGDDLGDVVHRLNRWLDDAGVPRDRGDRS